MATCLAVFCLIYVIQIVERLHKDRATCHQVGVLCSLVRNSCASGSERDFGQTCEAAGEERAREVGGEE